METVVAGAKPAIDVLKLEHKTSSGNSCDILGDFKILVWLNEPSYDDIKSVHDKLLSLHGPGISVMHTRNGQIIAMPLDKAPTAPEEPERKNFKIKKLKVRRT